MNARVLMACLCAVALAVVAVAAPGYGDPRSTFGAGASDSPMSGTTDPALPQVVCGPDDDEDEDEDEDSDAAQCFGGVTSMKLVYTGDGCSSTSNDQNGLVQCTGDAGGYDPVDVVVRNGWSDDSVYTHDYNLTSGDVIEVRAQDAGDSLLPSALEVLIADGLEQIQFDASCNEPLHVGDEFGSVRVVELTSGYAGTVTLAAEESYACTLAKATFDPEASTVLLEGSFCDEPEVFGGQPGGDFASLPVLDSGPNFILVGVAEVTALETCVIEVECLCADCAMEVALWDVEPAEGPAGPTGPQGPSGPTGPTGAAGATGAQGPAGPSGGTGPQGPAGPTGAPGPMGLPGPAGPAGENGEDGEDGAPGPTGPTGPTGPAGADGATGSQGPQGATGPTGPQGADGAPGAMGPTGTTGPVGPTGSQGEQGPAGPTGPQGENGAAGATGPQGPSGPTGAAGTTGATGPTGPQGVSGAAGATGPTGPTGPQGPSGPTGTTGAAGATGPTGPQGANGVAGATGPTGPQGPSGTPGAAGPMGLQGPTGPQGPAGETPTGSCPEGECVVAIGENGALVCGPCADGGGCDVATTTRVGQWCVENLLRLPAQNFEQASAACHAAGKSICPIDALMLCDVLDDSLGSQASCINTTDNNILRIWTSTYATSFGESVFQAIVVYGEDNKAFKANIMDLYPFYCCDEVD
jgi:hypothetical protein